MISRSYVLRAFVESPWAILPSTLAVLDEIVTRHVYGEKLEAEEIQARIGGGSSRPTGRRVHNVAILPLFGTIVGRGNMMTDVSGASSAERFAADFDALVKDPEIGAIVIDVDSPGGQVRGIEELARQIYDARGSKPIVSIANHSMASAAYWIGSAADEIVVTPSGEVGSIGVLGVHRDISGAEARDGVKTTVISQGKYKTEANQFEPLSEEARAALQARIDEIYEQFVEAVARNRGVEIETVRSGFGEGRMVSARKAVEMGMADRVDTLNGTLSRLLGTSEFATKTIRAENLENQVASSAPLSDLAHQAKRLRDYVQIHK
ncbi:MAG TPA: peptidase S49 [Anaerolineae bacterium]|jgi:signal peptide peptidase SppA|nr:peptidase S49 [Anaerolineae bacterium]